MANVTDDRVSYRDALRRALSDEMAADENVLLVGEDIRDPFGGSYKVTRGLSTEYGDERVRNTPISEEATLGLALGAALTGLRPVAELMYMDFIGRCMDVVVNQIPKMRYMSGGRLNVPLVIRTQIGAGMSSGSQHGNALEAFVCHLPGWLVAMPSTPADAYSLLRHAIRVDDPVFFIENRYLYGTKGHLPSDPMAEPSLGVARIVRPGRDVTVVATSRMARIAVEVAEKIAEDGVSVEVIDPRTLVPFDWGLVTESVVRTQRLVVVNEAPERCGWAAYLAGKVQHRLWDELIAPIEVVAARNVPVPFAPVLEKQILPNGEGIAAAISRTLTRT